MQPSGSPPGPHPLPPQDLASNDLPIRVTSQSWYRFHSVGHSALYWAPHNARPFPFRFDAPSGEYGVLYVGADEPCAFIETFGHNTGIRRVGLSDLRARCLSRVDVSRPLRLVDLTGPRFAHLGADARLFAGDYEIARQWGLAFFVHPSEPDGIYYPSRHDPDRFCAAIFDRVAPHLKAVRLGSLADPAHTELLRQLLTAYKFGLGSG